MSTQPQELKLEITQEKNNPLLKRKEYYGYVIHEGRGTPRVYELREYIAKLFGVPIETVFIRKIISEFGLRRSKVEFHIYSDPEFALKIEPEHIIIKNLPPEEAQKKKEELKKLREQRKGKK